MLKVDHQLWRLSSHPAIVVLAGNNENEAALATDWYNTSATAQEKEYYYGEGFIIKLLYTINASPILLTLSLTCEDCTNAS